MSAPAAGRAAAAAAHCLAPAEAAGPRRSAPRTPHTALNAQRWPASPARLRRQRPVVDGPVQHAAGAGAVSRHLHAVGGACLAVAALYLREAGGKGFAGGVQPPGRSHCEWMHASQRAAGRVRMREPCSPAAAAVASACNKTHHVHRDAGIVKSSGAEHLLLGYMGRRRRSGRHAHSTAHRPPRRCSMGGEERRGEAAR